MSPETQQKEPPASFPPPVAATIDWLRGRFREYYRSTPPQPPDRFTRREFGFLLWPNRPGPPPFVRHKGYPTWDRALDTLVRRAPHSVYYSTAYYRKPHEMKMVDKQWLGAELIFDLDADHLVSVEAAKERGEDVPIEQQLREVKELFVRLLDEFLLGDFGLDEKDMFLTFSGGRGYHAHVMDDRFLQLGNRERREIVDYITGKVPTKPQSTEPDMSRFIQKVAVQATSGPYAKAQHAYRIAPHDAPGWQGRLTRGLVQVLEEKVLQRSREEATAWLTSLSGIGKKSAEGFLDKFDERRLARVREGQLSHGADVLVKVCRSVLSQWALPMARGETDEPVTADVKRLIRLPGSLHGKSGLRVVTMRRDELDDFDPFRDAVAFDLAKSVEVVPRFDQEVTLGGETARVLAGQVEEVPEPHAVWLLSRQMGTIAT